MDYDGMNGAISSIENAKENLKTVNMDISGTLVVKSNISNINSAKTSMRTRLSDAIEDLVLASGKLQSKMVTMKTIDKMVKGGKL